MVATEEVVKCLLEASTSCDASTRQSAEAVLTAHLTTPGFPTVLLEVLLSDTTDPAARQLAGVLIKTITKRHWVEASQYEDPVEVVSEADKATLRNGLPRAFFITSTKLSTIAGVALGEVAQHDFPDECPTLLTDLVSVITTTQPPAVVSAVVKCLMIISEGLGEAIITHYIEVASGCLFQVVMSDAGEHVRRNALIALTNVVQDAKIVFRKAESLPQMLQAALPGFVGFCEGLIKDVAKPLLSSSASTFLNLLILSYPNACTTFLSSVVTTVCTTLAHLQSKDPNDIEEGYTSEGDIFGYSDLMLRLLQLLENSMKKRKKGGKGEQFIVRPAVSDALGLKDAGRMTQLFHLLVGCARLTEEEIETYQGNPGAYLQDEDQMEEGRLWNLRDTSCCMAELLHDSYKEESLQTFLTLCNSLLEKRDMEWRSAEAALLLLDCAFRHTASLKKLGFSEDVILQMVRSVLSNSNPFLVGRALFVANRAIKAMKLTSFPKDIVSQVASLICNPSQTHIVKSAALRTFIFSHSLVEGGVDSVPNVVAAVRQTIGTFNTDPLMEGDTLLTYIEELTILIGLHRTVDVASLPREAIHLWMAHYENTTVTESVLELFRELTANTTSEPSIREVLPFLLESLTKKDVLPEGMLSSAVSMLVYISKKAGETLLGQLVAQSFPTMGRLMASQHCTQAISLYMRTTISRVGGAAMLSLPVSYNGETTNALFVALDAAMTSLKPGFNEQAMGSTGKFVLELVDGAGAQLGTERLGALLALTVDKALAAQTTTMFQELLLPIAGLAVTRTEDVVAFLSRTEGNTSTTRLHHLIQRWVKEQPSFFMSKGEYHLFLAAITSIVASMSSHGLTNFQVKVMTVKEKTVSVEAGLAGFLMVANSYVQAAQAKDGDFGGDFLADLYDDDDEEDEEEEDGSEGEDGEDVATSDDDDISSDDSEAFYKVDTACLYRIYGTEAAVLTKVRGYLAQNMGTFAPQCVKFISEGSQRFLQAQMAGQ